MARFYGTVWGGRGTASRLGHGTKGLTTTAQSYSGDVSVRLFDVNGEDHVHIRIEDHNSSSRGVCLYDGPIADMLDKSKASVIVQATLKALAPELLVA